MAPPWQSLYPFQSREIRLGGHRYHYLDEGEGPPLLLVHGNPAWSFHWRNLILSLRSHFRLIACDHIGSGLSDKPQNYPYRLQTHVENLTHLISHLDLKQTTLLAQDWGGAIGLGAALAAPDRFQRFVLFNTAAFRSTDMPWRIAACRIPLLGPLAVRGLNGFVRAALRMALARPSGLSPAEKAGILAPYDSWAHRVAILRFVQDIPLHPQHPSYDALSRIEAGLPSLADRPFLFVWGMQDWCFTPKFLARFLEFFPAAEVHRLPEAGHWVVEDAHEQIVPLLIDWFQRHELRPESPQDAPHEARPPAESPSPVGPLANFPLP